MYTDRVPLVINKSKTSRLPDLPNDRFLFLGSFRVFQMMAMIRSKLELNKVEAVYFFV